MINELAGTMYSRLSGGTALTSLLASTASIYHGRVPDGAAFPYVVFNLQGGGDENITPSRMKNIVLYVRGYSKTSQAGAGSIDAQIDALLHGQTLSVSGWVNFWTARESDLSGFEPMPNGETIWNAGGMYRIRIDKT